MKFTITKINDEDFLFNSQKMHVSVLYRTARAWGFQGNHYKFEQLLKAIDRFPLSTITFEGKDEENKRRAK